MHEGIKGVVANGRDGNGESGQPSDAVHRPPSSYENLIVSHTKANRLSILRQRLSLSSETAEWFARVAPASLQLPPSAMLSLSFSLPLFASLSLFFSCLPCTLLLSLACCALLPFASLFIGSSN